jgi:hypothetical protein
MKNNAAIFQNSPVIIQVIKHRVTIGPCNFAPRFTSKGNENVCSYKNLSMNVYWSIIHNILNVEATQMTII